MVDMAHIAGLVAAGCHPNPVEYADIVTTTTHKTLRGPRGGMILTNDEALAKKINSSVFPGCQGGPLMHVVAAKAVAFKEALEPSFATYADQIIKNAKRLGVALQNEGIDLVSGGTDNHLMLLDLTSFNLTGKEVEGWMDAAHLTANKNTIPNDPQKPNVTSGIRLGTPSVTSRGMNTADMDRIAEAISIIVKEKEAGIPAAKAIVEELTAKYPLN